MSIPVITPAGPLTAIGSALTHFTADQSVTWSVDDGTLSGITSVAVDWTPPNKSGSWHLHATNAGSEVGTVIIAVEALIPNYWEFQNPIAKEKKALEFEPIDGPTQHRVFGEPNSQEKWELGADDSGYQEYLEILAFFEWHHPGKPFLLHDPVIDEYRRYETDSNWASAYKLGDSYSWKFKIKEVWPYQIVL